MQVALFQLCENCSSTVLITATDKSTSSHFKGEMNFSSLAEGTGG